MKLENKAGNSGKQSCVVRVRVGMRMTNKLQLQREFNAGVCMCAGSCIDESQGC